MPENVAIHTHSLNHTQSFIEPYILPYTTDPHKYAYTFRQTHTYIEPHKNIHLLIAEALYTDL